MGCDHGSLSPAGTVVLASWRWHDGRVFWHAGCCRCGLTVASGVAKPGADVRRVAVGRIRGEDTA